MITKIMLSKEKLVKGNLRVFLGGYNSFGIEQPPSPMLGKCPNNPVIFFRVLPLSVWKADDEVGEEEKRVCLGHREAASQKEGGLLHHHHHYNHHHHHHWHDDRHHILCHDDHDHLDLVIRSRAARWLSRQRSGRTLVKLTRLTSSSGDD